MPAPLRMTSSSTYLTAFETVTEMEMRPFIGEASGQEKAKALVELNPKAVLEDKELPYLPDPINPKEKEKSFKIRIPNIFKRK